MVFLQLGLRVVQGLGFRMLSQRVHLGTAAFDS